MVVYLVLGVCSSFCLCGFVVSFVVVVVVVVVVVLVCCTGLLSNYLRGCGFS